MFGHVRGRKVGVIQINDSLYGGAVAYNTIAKIQRLICERDGTIVLKINYSGRVGLPSMFMIGVMPIYGKTQGKNVRIIVSHKMYVMLSRINVIDYYLYQNRKKDVEIDYGLLLKKPAFRDIKNSKDIIQFINELSMEVPLKLSDDMSEILTSRIGEIFLNALEHAGATNVIGGKYYRNSKNRYCFTCYDDGQGIINNVQEFNQREKGLILSDKEALKWAMEPGHSTSNSKISRGIGLSMLKEFAMENGFTVRVCSGTGYYELNGQTKRERFMGLKEYFRGTIFEVNILASC